MQHQLSNSIGLRKLAIGGAIAALFTQVPVWAGVHAPPAVDQELGAGAGSASPSRVYSVINLGPEAGASALLNERGQAAFGSINYFGVTNGFFDGDRVRAIGTLGGSYSWVWGLNRHGVVVGESEDGAERSNILGFAWTLARGMRALARTSVSSARAINDRNHIVGLTPAPGISARALRWTPDGSGTSASPLPHCAT